VIVLAWLLVATPVVLFIYAYLLYPALLRLARPGTTAVAKPVDSVAEWPSITISVPAYNAERSLARTLDHLLAADYPADKRQIIVTSDGSTDRTEEIARAYADRGVELLRVPRGGKALAENAASRLVRGAIVVNTDATIVVPAHTIKTLVRHYADPAVGLVSGRDLTVPSDADPARTTRGEAGYSGYEMWVRSLEARLGFIAGATGSIYSCRREIFQVPISPYASRDFASAMIATQLGYRSVADDDAFAYVGHAPSLLAEYRRKARTMVLGLDTLWDYRAMLDPIRYGWFALMLVSHKLCRWLVYLFAPFAAVGLVLLATYWWPVWILIIAGTVVAVVGWLAINQPTPRRTSAVFVLPGYVVATGWAAIVAWLRFFRGVHSTVWEPTKRAG
jgi:cellulose synthase/poly-beta-1,6-N-acetylglucosamine synthase-like glycosyltransferase